MLISPIYLIAHENHQQVLSEDFASLFKNVDFGKDGYKSSDFQFKQPSNGDGLLMQQRKSMIAFCVWEKSAIYFSDDYFELEEQERIAYFFHEICHFTTYSLNPESINIVEEGNKIKDEWAEEAANNNGMVTTQILLHKHNHLYLLNLFNEWVADREMLSLNERLYTVKLRSSIKNAFNNVEEYYYHNAYIKIIDCMRSIKLVKTIGSFESELKELEKLLSTLIKSLKDDCDEKRYEVYSKFKEKLSSSYESGKAANTIANFNKLAEALCRI